MSISPGRGVFVYVPILIVSIVALRGAHATRLDAATDAVRVPLEPAPAIACYRLEGKRLSDTALPGELRAVSATTAEIAVEFTLAARESVRLVVEGMDA